ncbi:MAG: hydroxymethylglutaryl-CoA synthase, partial [Actinobacteria bacterium]|nr:hydroxymethylglutaryl-CoA synthase [Actinomycetota bacterium]
MTRGILDTSMYVPAHRLQLADVGDALRRNGSRGSRSVAAYDEDATTMAVAAASGIDASVTPGRLLLASTNPAYLDKSNAATVHAALGLHEHVLAADAGGSVRSVVAALLLALDGQATTMVVGADVIAGRPGSVDESEGGDGAAAVLVGEATPERPLLAELVGHESTTIELLDRWRNPGDDTSSVWEDRFG